MKKLLRHPITQSFISHIVALYYRFVLLTSSVEIDGLENLHERWKRGDQALLAAFHGRLMFVTYILSKHSAVNALISEHTDGQIISKVAKRFGLNFAAGSSTRGGAKAVRQLMKVAKAGESIFITPDGPKGPRMSVSKGTIEVAKLTKLPIYPFSGSYSKAWKIKSWDKFLIPKPFGKIYICIGKPIVVKGDSNDTRRQEQQQDLMHLMIELQNKADRHTGQGLVPAA